MELKLEIKLASTEELANIAKALSGMTVTSSADRQVGTTTAVSQFQNKEEVEESEEMEDVPSPYTAHPSEVKTAPAPTPAKTTAADKKAQKEAEKEAKKLKDEQDKADRIARLKADMEKQQAQVANTPPAANTQVQDIKEEPNEAIVAEIQALGDALMGFQGMPLEAKQKLTGDIITKLGVQGVRPTQLQQPLLGQFRDMYRSAVNSVINPVMGGLV